MSEPSSGSPTREHSHTSSAHSHGSSLKSSNEKNPKTDKKDKKDKKEKKSKTDSPEKPNKKSESDKSTFRRPRFFTSSKRAPKEEELKYTAADFDLELLRTKELELTNLYKRVRQDSDSLRIAIKEDNLQLIKDFSHRIAKALIQAEDLKNFVFSKSLDSTNNHLHDNHPF